MSILEMVAKAHTKVRCQPDVIEALALVERIDTVAVSDELPYYRLMLLKRLSRDSLQVLGNQSRWMLCHALSRIIALECRTRRSEIPSLKRDWGQ